MPVVGPRFPHAHIRSPVWVFAPPLPTQQQQTIKTTFASRSRRLTERQRFTSKTRIPAVTRLNSGAHYSGGSAMAIGPQPPMVAAIIPSQKQQTITVKTAADHRRRTELRRFPLQGWTGRTTFRSPATVTEFDQGQRAALNRLLGPRPPVVITALPTAGQQTIRMATAVAARGRRERGLRFPLQGWTGVSVYEQGGSQSVLNSGTATSQAIFGQTGNAEERIGESISSSVPVTINSIRVGLNVGSSPATDSVVVTLQTSSAGAPSGVILQTATIPAASLPAFPQIAYVDLPFSFKLDVGVTYWLVFYRSVPNPTTSYDLATAPPNAAFLIATFDGATWTTLPGSVDVAFLALTGGRIGGAFSRNLGPRPPMIVNPVLAQPKIVGPYIAPFQRVTPRRGPKSFLGEPQVLARPPPPPVQVNLATGILSNWRRIQQRAPMYVLRPPITAETTFVAPPLNVNCLPPDRLARRFRRQAPGTNLGPPTVLTTFAGPQVNQAQGWLVNQRRAQQRRTHSSLPLVVFQPPIGAVAVNLASGLFTNQRRLQQRRPDYLLPQVVFQPTTFVAPPLSVNCLQPDRLARRYRRLLPQSSVGPPTVLQTFFGPQVNTATGLLTNQRRVQQRRTTHDLTPPTVLQVFAGPTIHTVKTRPRPTVHALGKPTVVRVPSVEQQQDTIKVTLVRARPRHTVSALYAPQVIRTPSVEQREQTISVSLARIRPRPIRSVLPQVVVAAAAFMPRPVSVTLVAISGRAAMTRRFPLSGWDGDSAAGPTAPGRYPNTILAAGPISYWRLGEAPGAPTAVDQIGGNNGTYAGTVTLGQPGLVTGDPDTAAAFGAGNANVAVPTPLLAGQTAWTFECLFRGPISAASRVLYEEVGTTNDLVSIRATAGSLSLSYRDDAGVLNSVALSTGGFRLDDGGIHHIVVTRSGTAVQGIVDGTKVGNNVIGGGAQTESITATIGRTASGPNGAMQEVAIYHRTLTSGEALQHYLASVAGAPDQAVYLRRNLGPKPPLLIVTAPTPDETKIVVRAQAVQRRTTEVRRRAKSQLFPPATLAQPPPAGYAVFVTLAKSRVRRANTTLLRPPTVLATFAAGRPALVSVRPRPTTHRLAPPTVIRIPSVEQREQTVTVSLVRARPRHTISLRIIPATLVPYSVVLAEDTIRVTLVRARPRPTTTTLASPVVLQTFVGPSVTLVKTRPRPTRRVLGPPTVVRVPSVEQREQTIAVTLVHTRPRATRSDLPLVTFPTTTPVETVISVTLTRIRPRHTVALLLPPATLEPESVQIAERQIGVHVVRIRPRPTTRRLAQPTTLQTFSGPTVHLVRARPRPTHVVKVVPSTLEPFAVELREETIRVTLARTRPRPTAKTLRPPTVLQVFTGPSAPLVRTRPRPTVKYVFEPTVIRVPAVEQQEDTIRVTLVRARPRPTVKFVAPPQVLQTFAVGRVALVVTRPRHTIARLNPPTVVRVPSVEQQEDTIRVALVRTRPRPTTKTLGPPRVVRVPSVEQQEQTVRVTLVHTRPRPTVKTLAPPAVVARPPVGKVVVSLVQPRERRNWNTRFPDQGQRQRVVRETGTTVTNQLRDPFIGPRPPQIIDPLPTQQAQTITVALVAVRTRREQPRHTVEHFLRAPTVVIPLPTQRQQTVQVTKVRVRPRHTIVALRAPTVVDRTIFAAPETPFVRTRPRATTKTIFEPTVLRTPSVEQQLRTIRTTLVRTRPRPTTKVLGEPTVLRTFTGPVETEIAVRTLLEQRRHAPHSRLAPPTVLAPVQTTIRVQTVETRPRPTTRFLRPPTVLRTFRGPVETEVAVQTVTTDLRRRQPHSRLPIVVVAPPVETRIHVTVVHTRPRHTRSVLAPPAVVTAVAIETRATRKMVRGRRPITTSRLAPPTVLRTFDAATVTLVTTRPRPIRSRLSPPTVVRPFIPPVVTTLTVWCVAVESRLHRPHTLTSLPLVVLPSVAKATGVTEGYDIAAASAQGEAFPGSNADGLDIAANATGGHDRAATATEGDSIASTGTDGEERSL